MSAPTSVVRRAVTARDDGRCVYCHTTRDLTFQHRRATGMGGSKNRPAPVDGLTLCIHCNQAVEADLQTTALAYGIKIRRWANPELVPVYFPHEFGWYRLHGVTRTRISGPVAVDLMHSVYGDEWMRWYQEANN